MFLVIYVKSSFDSFIVIHCFMKCNCVVLLHEIKFKKYKGVDTVMVATVLSS